MNGFISEEKNKKTNDDFRKLLQEVSIECIVNGYPNCRNCKPTDEPLYVQNPLTDMNMPDPCKQIGESTIKPDGEVEYDGKKYMYKKNADTTFGYDFFIYSKKLIGYIPLDPADPLCMELLRVLEPDI